MKFLPRYRLWFLVAVNALIFYHVYAYYFLGQRAVGCVDFFGLATFLGKGQVTAGTVFLAGLILVTLLAGRVFCGWGCHFALFQDLCTKLLARLGFRTSFRRSRLEYVVPPIMLVVTLLYPIAVWWGRFGKPHDVTTDLSFPEVWHLLPGLKGVVLILFVDVVLLTVLFGSRAFCRYVCPYGLFLKFFHLLSPVRVVKAGDCSGCGSCTRACPTGVPIRHEVETFGVIRDLNCMNCGDCVAVCPTGALAIRPTTRGYRRLWNRGVTFSFQPVWVEATLLTSVVAGLLVFRGREYGDFLAAGMGLVTGATVAVAVAPVRFISPRLSSNWGAKRVRVSATIVAVYLTVGLLAQGIGTAYLRSADRALETGRYKAVLRSFSHASRFASATEPFTFYLDDFNHAAPRQVERLMRQADQLMASNNWSDAELVYRTVLTIAPEQLQASGNLGTSLYKQGRYWEAAPCFMKILEYDPHDLVALYHLAMTKIQLGELQEASTLVQLILEIDGVGNAYDLIQQNPLFHLLDRQPRYRSAMASYRPRASHGPEKLEGRP